MPPASPTNDVQLYHAPSSYYSMIARLALVEAGIDFAPRTVDIHRRMAQFEPGYVRVNPQMTVPALTTSERVITDSRDILAVAFGDEPGADAVPEPVTQAVARHYRFAVDELTFSWLLKWNPIARRMVPKTLAAARDRLDRLAAAEPELADLYRRRSAVFAGRIATFDPSAVAALHERRWSEAADELDWLETVLGDGRAFLCGDSYGPADVVWTVFLARIRFIRRAAEIERRPALRAYDTRMRARPSFRTADVWPALDPIKFVRQLLP
ncbi:MAG: glutathione S-transferase family protein [Salinarimonas sp.]